MFEALQHIRERNIKESFDAARTQIADDILYGSGFKLGCEKWTIKHIIELIYECGDDDRLAQVLHQITSAQGKEAAAEGIWALDKLLRDLMEKYLPDELIEEVAKDICEEASLSRLEAEHKDSKNGLERI